MISKANVQQKNHELQPLEIKVKSKKFALNISIPSLRPKIPYKIHENQIKFWCNSVILNKQNNQK